MRIKKIKIRYLLIAWLIIYILISLFKYIKLKTLIYNKYGLISKTFSTKMYINESILIDGAMLIVGFPVLLLSGGWNFTQWAYSDVKFDFNQKLTTYIELKPKFMQNKFQVTMRGGKIVEDTFINALATDPKFQHLYSEWVKKQVGIEDDGVELEFKGAMKSSAWVGDKPYIDFSNINTLDNLEEQICKNTHNLYLHTVVMNNFKSSNATDVLEVVKEYESLLKPYIFNGGDNLLVFGVELNELINDKNDPFSYDILFNYNTNEKRYFKYYKNRPLENNKSEYIYFE